jgi:hypothetical protein
VALGDLKMSVVENKNRDNREPSSYFHTTISYNGNDFTDILLTGKELQKAIDRAERNPEDIPQVNFIAKFWRWLKHGW